MPSDHLERALVALDEAVQAALGASLLDHKTPLQNERGLARAGDLLLLAGSPRWLLFSGDINDFKNLNSTLGYDTADLVLAEVGQVLQGLTDHACVGFRRGGDEFVLLVPEMSLDVVLTALSQKLSPLAVPVEGVTVEVFTSFGYARLDLSLTFRDNLERADQACKAAKWSHQSRVVEWSPDIETGFSARLRCSACRTQVSISVSPERSKSLGPLACMVCGEPLDASHGV